MVCNGDYSMFCLHLFEPWAPSSIWCSGPLFSTEEVVPCAIRDDKLRALYVIIEDITISGNFVL